MRAWLWLVRSLILHLAACSCLLALDVEELQSLGFKQYPGKALSLGLAFRDQDGKEVRLGDYFERKDIPVLLVPGYFRCEMLCSGVSDGLLRALQGVRKTAGSDFRVIFVSIDPSEQVDRAQRKKRTWLKRYGRPEAEDGPVFLCGEDREIKTFAEEIGFQYRYDPASNEFAHPAGFVVATPEGRIYRYFLGVTFSAAELENAINDAVKGKESSFVKDLFLLCFHYNPLRSPYSAVVMISIRLLSVGTMAALVLAIVRSRRNDKGGKGS